MRSINKYFLLIFAELAAVPKSWHKSLPWDLVTHWDETPTEEGRGRGGRAVGGGYSRLDDGMGAKIKRPQNPKGFQQNPTKSLDLKFTSQKFHVDFLSLKHFQKALLIK